MTLFRGRSDAYARRWEKDGRSGYSPAYDFNWEEFISHKRLGGSLKNFENKRLLPLTPEVVRKHLLGSLVVGIYPVLRSNESVFLAADFDGANWKAEAGMLIGECSQLGLTTYLERSRSGNGGHIWLFFDEPYPCQKSRRIGLELIRRAFDISEFEKEVSFDRLFPNQDSVSAHGFGNLIALPMQGGSVAMGNSVFIDLQSGNPYPDQWRFLEEARRYLPGELDEIYMKLFSQKQGNYSQAESQGGPLVISVGKQLVLARSQLRSGLIQFLKEELNFLNTEYLSKRRIGKSVYKVQKYFKLIDESEGNVLLPRGFLEKLLSFLRDQGIAHEIRAARPDYPRAGFKSSINLTKAQQTAVQSALGVEQGVIVAPAGSGKTIMGLELIARRGLPALILVHRKQIMDQWIERIQSFLGIDKAHIGECSGARKKVGREITVALLQSLGRKSSFDDLQSQFGTVVVDECHHIPASTFRKVVSQLNPRYLYGLTATPHRKHNDEDLIFLYIGEIVARVEASDFMPASLKSSSIPEVIVRQTKLAIPFKFRTDLFQLLAKVVCFDSGRNQMIVEDILRETEQGKKVLVLSERKEHLEVLDLYLKGRCETIVISGDDSPPSRKSKFKQIEDGHYRAVLSTGQFFGEGFDFQGISCLVLAFPFSFEGKLMQYIGRLRDVGIERRIIDYRDKNIPFLEKQYKQRERYYKKMHAKIGPMPEYEPDLPF